MNDKIGFLVSNIPLGPIDNLSKCRTKTIYYQFSFQTDHNILKLLIYFFDQQIGIPSCKILK